MKEFIIKLLAPLAKNTWAYLIVVILLIIGGVRLTKLYMDSGKKIPKIEKLSGATI